jgi:hypothetical protein
MAASAAPAPRGWLDAAGATIESRNRDMPFATLSLKVLRASVAPSAARARGWHRD